MRLEVDPGDSGGRNGIGCARERGLGTVVENVEAANAVVEIVVGKELWEVQGLVLHCDMRLVLYWTSLCDMRKGTHLPYKLPCTLHHPEAEA